MSKGVRGATLMDNDEQKLVVRRLFAVLSTFQFLQLQQLIYQRMSILFTATMYLEVAAV